MKNLTFQKINLLLISYLSICILIEIIVLINDFYSYIKFEHSNEQKDFDWQFIEWAFVLIAGLFIVIIPNTFSIIVHDIKASMTPPINKWSILIKNLPIYILIVITLIALVSLAYFKDNDTLTFVANKIAGNRIGHQNDSNLGSNLLMFGLFLLLVLPIISFYNWLHYIGVIIYRVFKVK